LNPKRKDKLEEIIYFQELNFVKPRAMLYQGMLNLVQFRREIAENTEMKLAEPVIYSGEIDSMFSFVLVGIDDIFE
jgi:hypothetical protein